MPSLFIFQNRDGIYTQLVKDMISSKQTRLIVNINDLRRVNPQRAQRYSILLRFRILLRPKI